ncbi:L-serine ammonia-lyase, partial [Campylobacter coli]|nr:L-serine ammonia-lyase [Campylobacter coli]
GLVDEETYYSVGGGFVLTTAQLEKKGKNSNQNKKKKLDIELNNAKEALELCDKRDWDLAELSYRYELQFHTKEEIRAYCLEIWEVMQEVYYNGTHPNEDYLPGKLHLKRRAKGLKERVAMTTDPMGIIDFISLYAIAIAEENASGAKVVTAPTNGACAVIPAVMLYLKNHTIGFSDEKAIEFLLVAMLIGSFYKKNASISGAEAGCQAEIGSASSMAAAAMATVLGANAFKACNAAEMAMEHHLGLTCDPVGGLVQIPCIERNAFGAIKAISAARMAMTRKSIPIVSLDEVIETMYETGKDMNYKYKETSLGGLATNLKTVC